MHSPKRDAAQFGQHFKLDDCRVWMRLPFWAAREAGLLCWALRLGWRDGFACGAEQGEVVVGLPMPYVSAP